MVVMGERPPEVWTDEWRRSRRVVFPLRRWTYVQLPVLPMLAFIALSAPGVAALLDDGLLRYAAWVVIAAYAGGIGTVVWQLVTRRPVLVVDRRGLRRGPRFLPWNEIGGVGFVTGPRPARQLPVQPKDARARNLVLTQQHVSDLSAFRLWLGELLDEYRDPIS
jgi:hypothetical protein